MKTTSHELKPVIRLFMPRKKLMISLIDDAKTTEMIKNRAKIQYLLKVCCKYCQIPKTH